MVQLSITDYDILIGYFAVIITLSILFRAKSFAQVFGEDRKPNWILLAASILMIEWSPMTDMMNMGLILQDGYSGIWMLKNRFWLAGVPAILYASMWSRLPFKTDNELLRLRYSGRSGVFLHIFRAVYLSIFVIPLFASFIILALRKFVNIVFSNSMVNTDLLLIIAVILLVLKNTFHQKIRTDLLNAVICVCAPVMICFFLLKSHGGFEGIYGTITQIAFDEIQLFPTLHSSNGYNHFADFLVFICIQWWSVNIVDNSDPNAQRHIQAKGQFASFKTLFIPIILSSLMFVFVSTIWDCGLLDYKLNKYHDVDAESFYLQVALQHLPDGFKAIAIIAILFSFISTLESIINWGGGMLTVDVFQKYIHKVGSDDTYSIFSFLAMCYVSCASLFFAFNTDKIITLQLFVFSISAGVAPVYLLRWFWWRINAWTQFSAMLASLLYTLAYDYFYQHCEVFHRTIELLCSSTTLSPYPLKLVVLTMLVIGTWLIVMYNTSADEKEHLRNFVKMTGAGGIWPSDFAGNQYHLRKRLFLCFIFAIVYILPFLFIWQFKFGNQQIAIVLLFLFVGLLCFVYRSMSFLLPTDK